MEQDKRKIHESREAFAEALMSDIEREAQKKVEGLKGGPVEVNVKFTVHFDPQGGGACCICRISDIDGLLNCYGRCCDRL